MANSIIDDMIKEQVPNENPKKNSNGNKKSFKGVIFLIILLIIVMVAGVFVVLYLKKNEITPKLKFIEALRKNNLSTILDFENYNSLIGKQEEQSSETTSDISFSVDSPFIKFEGMTLGLKNDKDVENKKSYTEANLNYKESNILSLKTLTSSDSFAIKLEDILIKYVGAKYENLGKILGSFSEDAEIKEALENLDFRKVFEAKYSIPNIPQEVFNKYIDIIAKNVDDISFGVKKVTIQRDSGNLDTTEYSLTVDEEKMLKLLEQTLQTLKSDELLLNILFSNFQSEEINSEVIKSYIDNIITELYSIEVNPDNKYSLKLYENSDKTVKMSIDLAGKLKIDFDYEYKDKENSAIITFLNPENNNGLTITLKKTISDVLEDFSIVIGMIENSEIIGELEISSNLLNSQTSYEIKNKVNLKYSIVNCTLEANSKTMFKQVEVDDLSKDNCLFLDTINEDTLNITLNEIKEKAIEVISENLNKGALSLNDYSKVVEQPNITPENNEEKKEIAKQKIIDGISNAMGEAMANNRTYTLLDVESLEIPDSEVNISVNDDIAIINIDGFVFTLDSEFKLYNN